jgi:nucleoside-diphosphate-sugar epimerase
VRTALIGHSGFIGSNLKDQYKFDDFYNSKNIHELKDREYDVIFCCGAPGLKWHANKFPKEDKESLEILTKNLNTERHKKIVLISTISVYPHNKRNSFSEEFQVFEEDIICEYGRNRLNLEHYVQNNFENYLIVRLPHLIGPHLKKNIIFDLLNNNMVFEIKENFKLQFYSLDFLYNDIVIALSADIKKINLFGYPLQVSEILTLFNSKQAVNPHDGLENFNIKSQHMGVFDRSEYRFDKEEMLLILSEFINTYKKDE